MFGVQPNRMKKNLMVSHRLYRSHGWHRLTGPDGGSNSKQFQHSLTGLPHRSVANEEHGRAMNLCLLHQDLLIGGPMKGRNSLIQPFRAPLGIVGHERQIAPDVP